MDEERLQERKAAGRRLLVAGAASLAIHAVFFTLLFAFSPIAPRALPALEISSIQGETGESPRAAGSAGRAGPAPKNKTANPSAPVPPSVASASASLAGDALRDRAERGDLTQTESHAQTPIASSAPPKGLSAGASGSALAEVGEAGAFELGGAVQDDPVATLVARINAAIEARKTYPEAARRRGTEGVVALGLRVAEDGRLLAAKLAASSGSTLLDRSALDLASSVFPVDNLARRELELVVSVRYELKL